MLEVEGISVRYGNVQVLWDESFDVREGEILALLGPNGAGKTTTLKSIIGLLRPFSGTIRFLGKDLSGMRTFDIVRLGISLVPEGRRLFPHLSVRENLIMGAHAAKGGDGIEER
ncbi:MAG: ATP-binding cassette domain-containing protein, partial [Candidatus Bathyarchaeia archaeon]